MIKHVKIAKILVKIVLVLVMTNACLAHQVTIFKKMSIFATQLALIITLQIQLLLLVNYATIHVKHVTIKMKTLVLIVK